MYMFAPTMQEHSPPEQLAKNKKKWLVKGVPKDKSCPAQDTKHISRQLSKTTTSH